MTRMSIFISGFLLAMVFVLLIIPSVVQSFDGELFESCVGDSELLIGCVGDSELFFLGSLNTPLSVIPVVPSGGGSSTSIDENFFFNLSVLNDSVESESFLPLKFFFSSSSRYETRDAKINVQLLNPLGNVSVESSSSVELLDSHLRNFTGSVLIPESSKVGLWIVVAELVVNNESVSTYSDTFEVVVAYENPLRKILSDFTSSVAESPASVFSLSGIERLWFEFLKLLNGVVDLFF